MGTKRKYLELIFMLAGFLAFHRFVKAQDYVRVKKDSIGISKKDSTIAIRYTGLGFKAYMSGAQLNNETFRQRLKLFPTSLSEINKYDRYLKIQQASELLCIGFGVAAVASYNPHQAKSFPGLAAALSAGCLGSMIIMHIQARRHMRLSVELYNKAIQK